MAVVVAAATEVAAAERAMVMEAEVARVVVEEAEVAAAVRAVAAVVVMATAAAVRAAAVEVAKVAAVARVAARAVVAAEEMVAVDAAVAAVRAATAVAVEEVVETAAVVATAAIAAAMETAMAHPQEARELGGDACASSASYDEDSGGSHHRGAFSNPSARATRGCPWGASSPASLVRRRIDHTILGRALELSDGRKKRAIAPDRRDYSKRIRTRLLAWEE